MIFAARMLAKVLDGSKTVTRRPVAADGAACAYKPGNSYAVQPGRGKNGLARIQVIAVDQCRLGDLDDAEARAEGFLGRDEFFGYWRILHGKVDGRQLVHRIEFRLERGPVPPRRGRRLESV